MPISNNGMMGYFNFHVSDVAETTAKRFLSIVDDLNFRQHITGPTHKRQHSGPSSD